MKSRGQRQSRKHEDRLAQVTGGRRVPGSGSSWSHKGDVRTDDVLLEHKWTDKRSYSVSAATWRKVETEAVRSGRTPVLGIRLEPADLNLIVMDEDDYLALREAANGR